MDNHTPEQRRRNMQSIRSKDSEIEIILRKKLWEKGLRYRKNYNKIIGKPDIVFIKKKIAIFCDSSFWHGREYPKNVKRIGTNAEYWNKKILRNMERDREVNEKLSSSGWTVLRFWDDEIKNSIDECIQKVIETYHGEEISANGNRK